MLPVDLTIAVFAGVIFYVYVAWLGSDAQGMRSVRELRWGLAAAFGLAAVMLLLAVGWGVILGGTVRDIIFGAVPSWRLDVPVWVAWGSGALGLCLGVHYLTAVARESRKTRTAGS
jgi:predicted histidine transporter YuiF (NhaC family)